MSAPAGQGRQCSLAGPISGAGVWPEIARAPTREAARAEARPLSWASERLCPIKVGWREPNELMFRPLALVQIGS